VIDARKNTTVGTPTDEEAPHRLSGVAESSVADHRESRAVEPQLRPSTVGTGEKPVRNDPPSNGHHLSGRHRPRIPPTLNPDDLLRSFLSGDPKVVYEEAKKFAASYQMLEKETAKLRFRINFGTETCSNCDGLRAGPDVLATCFQTQECRYTNVRTHTEKQLRVLAHLTDNG